MSILLKHHTPRADGYNLLERDLSQRRRGRCPVNRIVIRLVVPSCNPFRGFVGGTYKTDGRLLHIVLFRRLVSPLRPIRSRCEMSRVKQVELKREIPDIGPSSYVEGVVR